MASASASASSRMMKRYVVSSLLSSRTVTARLRTTTRAKQGKVSGGGFAKHLSETQQASRKKTLVSTVDSIMRETTEIERRAEENIRHDKKKKMKKIQGDTGIGDMLPEDIQKEHAARGRVDFVTVRLRQKALSLILSERALKKKIFYEMMMYIDMYTVVVCGYVLGRDAAMSVYMHENIRNGMELCLRKRCVCGRTCVFSMEAFS